MYHEQRVLETEIRNRNIEWIPSQKTHIFITKRTHFENILYLKFRKGKEVVVMYGNHYPNDDTFRQEHGSLKNHDDKNIVDGTAKEMNSDSGNYSGYTMEQNTYGSGGSPYGTGRNMYGGSENAYGGYSEGQKPPKKEKKGKGSYWRKALAAVSFGILFGVFAAVGFYAVGSVTGITGNGRQQADALSDDAGETGQKEVETENAADAGELTVKAADAAGKAIVMDVSDVAAEVMPAIVSINNTYTQTMSYFGQTLQSESTAAGSGIIVGENDEELLIVSNYHVIENADKLIVQFVDGTEAEAQMKGSDPDMDLAVIAVSMKDVDAVTREAITVAALGDSESLTVGEPAIAIGNALGYGQSVTLGVISALDRVIDLSTPLGYGERDENGATFIQTDAAINPGNSGGALLNMKGEVIGINSNKIGGDAVEGMGYAIPISAAKPIIEDLMLKETRAKVSEENKGYLGISPRTVAEEMAEIYGMPKGVYVAQVYEGTGASAAGIKKGNVITEFDGNKINSAEDLLRVMEYYEAGETVEVTLMQGSPDGWESRTVSVTLGEKFD